MNESLESQLNAAKIAQAVSKLASRITHHEKLSNHRLDDLEDRHKDHETRLRDATAGITQFRAYISFISILATVLSIIALIVTWVK